MATIGTNQGENARACKIVAALSFPLLLIFAAPATAADDLDSTSAPFVDTTNNAVTRDQVRALLAKRDDSGIRGQVAAFYAARDFEPAWTDQDASNAVQDSLTHADEQGLRSQDYAVNDKLKGAAREIALTDAAFRYAHDVRLGRVTPRAVYKDVRLPGSTFDVGWLLNQALKHHNVPEMLAALPPQEPDYQGLVKALDRYRAVVAAGGWPTVKAKDAESLSRRLALEDTAFATIMEPSDADVAAALTRFQERNGLPADGQLGPATLKALNVPASARVKAILASMERWRWMPHILEARYIRVNVPDQSADYIDNGKIVLHSKVIIGKATTPTPILRTEVRAVVANPAWDIPGDIAARQVLPKVRRDKNYLAERGFVLVSSPGVDWRKLPASQVALQQPPGPDNVLGQIMLDMPNDFDVYLHDTPNKKLFTQADREASNGCVRVEQIAALASLALTNDPQDGADRINDAIATGETTNIKLAHPLPVYVAYSTAVADADGNTGFRPDRYKRDDVLVAALAKPAPASNPLAPQGRPKKKST